MPKTWMTLTLVAAVVMTNLVALAADQPASAPAVAVTAEGGAAKPLLKAGDRLAIVGDSITEQKIYSKFMETYLTACTPQLDLWVIQLGWGGETAGGFVGRMDMDLLSFKPTVFTTCYGMNDGGYRAYAEGIGANYLKNMQEIVKRAKAAGATAVVGSPGAADSFYFQNRSASSAVYNESLGHLKDIARKLAADEGQVFANVHDVMMKVMASAKEKQGEKFAVCGNDGIHPGPNGQLIMAYAFLKALGLDGNLGSITLDMAGQATAADGHKVLSFKDGSAEIESSRYPFCFAGDEKADGGIRAVLPLLPFNQDLNRLTLVVTSLKSDKAKVTWGGQSKSFTKDQLAKGINLAAEFMDKNPFAEAFAAVDAKVAAKQAFETGMIKSQYHSLAGLQAACGNDAESAAAIKTLQAKLVARQETLRKEVKEAVKPVKHSIKVEPE